MTLGTHIAPAYKEVNLNNPRNKSRFKQEVIYL